jgi:hypothetical protein
MIKTNEVTYDIELYLESVIRIAERTYADPELDVIMDEAVTLSVQGKDPLEFEVKIDEKNPSREWILLQGYKGYKALADLYRNLGEFSLQKLNFAAALVRARAINKERDLTATALLPPLSVELHNAVENLAFFRSNMLKTSLDSSESSGGLQ